jgi:nitrite reductase/ring-hydroxylating ferredoxin subunit
MHRDLNDTDTARGAEHGDCGGCELADRRRFLQQAAALVAGALVGLGMSADRALAMPLGILEGVRSSNGKDVSFPIPAADGATIDRDNDLILARYQGKVYAFGLACPHQNTALRWLPAEGRFQCPKHKSKYAPDGIFLSGRATRSMDRYAVRKDGTNIVVNLDSLYEQDKQKGQWESAFVTA